MLGHADLATTELYTHVTDRAAATPTSPPTRTRGGGLALDTACCLRARPSSSARRDLPRDVAEVAIEAVVLGEPGRGARSSRAGAEPFFRQTTASRRTAWLSSADDQLVQERAHGVDDAGAVAREPLQRDERGAAAGRALVLEPASQQLGLLPEAELRRSPGRRRPARGSRRCARRPRSRRSTRREASPARAPSPASASASACAAASASVKRPRRDCAEAGPT